MEVCHVVIVLVVPTNIIFVLGSSIRSCLHFCPFPIGHATWEGVRSVFFAYPGGILSCVTVGASLKDKSL